MVSAAFHDPHDPGSNVGCGDCYFLFLMSIESDSQSLLKYNRDYNVLLRLLQFYNIILVQCQQ